MPDHDPLVCGISTEHEVPTCPGCLAELSPEHLATLAEVEQLYLERMRREGRVPGHRPEGGRP